MTRRKDGRWVQKVTLPDGTPKYFYSREQTEKKAEADIQKQLAAYTFSTYRSKHNFKAVTDTFMDRKESSISYNTYESYKNTLIHLEEFYDCDIENIKPSMVQKLLNDLALKGYSYSLLSKVRTVYGMILDFAIVNNDIPIANFTKSIKIPKTAKKGVVSAPDDEVIKIIVQNASGIDFGMWNMMLLCTGMRRGELCAIQKKDIDFKNNKIPITKAVEFHGNQPHLKDCPKTENSVGDVPILSILAPYLEQYCETLSEDDFLFGKENPLTISAIRRRTEKYCKTIGHSFNLHQLRHAYAKLLYCAGVDPKTMQRLLRHADFSTTMNIYAEFDNTVTKNNIELINSYMEKTF